MSILLEALRKSEKNQHSPEAPNIHTDDQPGLVSDSIKTGPLALLLVVALFASGWFVWQQYQLPAGSYQPPVTLKAEQTRTVPTSTENLQAGGEKAGQARPSSVASNNSAGKPRTPVESYQEAIRNISQAKPARTEPADAMPTKENDPLKQPAGDSSRQAAPRTAANDKSIGAAPKKHRRQQLAPISYWELPDAIRTDVGEIKYSVLVYAKKPADRFVLINGQRLVEGDSPQDGLVVKEIRRDGVVFSYRLYQFLVER